jgi:hypothetical protein
MKSGNLNFLEPSGPLQACNGTALPFTSTRYSQLCYNIFIVFMMLILHPAAIQRKRISAFFVVFYDFFVLWYHKLHSCIRISAAFFSVQRKS